MPIEWLLVGQAALNAGAGFAAKGVLGKAAKAGAGLFQRGGPLDKDLAGALAKAGEGFEASLYALYPDDRELSALVEHLAGREDFRQALGSLPYLPFASIDVSLLRGIFVERRATEDAGEDFDGAWRAASKRFAQAAAKKDEVKRFVDLQHQERSEQRDEEILSLLRSLEERQARAETPRNEEPILAAYRRGVYEEFRYADTSGLFQREKMAVGEAIGLEEIFVETQLGREPQRQSSSKEDGGAEADKTDEKKLQRRDSLSEPAEIQPIREVLSRDRLTVILGPPGSGKSTLMRCLALSVCRPPDAPAPVLDGRLDPTVVPVLLALKEYASALRDDPDLALDSFLFQRFASRLPRLKDLLESGRVLLLLDGFDEVFDERHRLWVKEQVWRLASQFSAARIVLTSRPHGYASAPLPGPVAVWKVQPFGEEEIRRFLHGWFAALAREGGEAGTQDPPEKRAEALAQEILSRERLKDMAENPLLSTLIVLVGRNRSGRLPDRRVVFFEAAAKTFAESWERAKHAPIQVGEERFEFPEPEILLRALAEVAWRAHHELGSREIPGETLRQWLGAYLEREPEWSGARGRRAVKDFLRLVDQRTGLLVELGGDAYQIVHLSLHEWFVSYYLLDRLTPENRLAVIRHYLHVPEWEEILRLTIAGARQAETEAMIAAILDRPSHELESQLRRDLRFVLNCLEDQAPIGPELRQRVADEAMEVLKNPRQFDLARFMPALPPLWGMPEVREEILRRLGDNDLFSSTVPFFAKVGLLDVGVQQAVLARLDAQNPDVRFSAIDFLTWTSAANETLRNAALARLDDENPRVRSSVIHFLDKVGRADEAVRQLLIARLNDDNPSVRSSAIEFFSQVGRADEIVRQLLADRLNDEDPNVRFYAINFFVRTGTVDETIWQSVLAQMDDENHFVQFAVVNFFTWTGEANESVRQAFFARLGDENPTIRNSAINFFAWTGAADDVRRLFLERLYDDDPSVRSSSVAFFTRAGAADENIQQAILARLDDEDSSVRHSVIYYLAQNGVSDVDVKTQQGVLAHLNDSDRGVKASAFKAAFLGGFLPDKAGDPLDLFRDLAPYMSFDLRIAEALGRRAAREPELSRRLVEEGPDIQYFQVGTALSTLASEQDRLRREASPLPF